MAHYDNYKVRSVSKRRKVLYYLAMYVDRRGVWKEIPAYYETSREARINAKLAYEKEAQEATK